MKLTRNLILPLSATALWFAPASADPSKPWAHDLSDIAAEENVTYGKLPNGLSYILMPNQQPPGRVSMRLHIDAGSLMERDDQRGVAHFLEHMVFNGSKSFPDASVLIPKMQRLGIDFGAHANAYTSFNETVYMLDLPNNEEDTLKLGFDVMRDFGDGALLNAKEIDKERGVILAEKTSRDSVRSRLMEQQFKAILSENLLSERFPIGIEKVIKEAPRSAFTDFYTNYYVPSRMTFVYVGDFDVAIAKQRIIDTFSSMETPENAGADPELGAVPTGQGFQTLILTDKEVDTTDISLLNMKAYSPQPDTKGNRAQKLPLIIANSIISNRLSALSKKEDAPFSVGSAFHYKLFKFMQVGGITVHAKDHNWKAALPVVENELRRAITLGFTTSEFDEVKAKLLNNYEQAVKVAASRKTHELATAIIKTHHKGEVFSSSEVDLELFKEHIENITPVVCHEAFQAFWDTQDATIILTTNESEEGDTDAIMEVYRSSRSIDVTKPAEKEVSDFAYTDFTTSDETKKTLPSIKALSSIKDLGISQMQFHNDCRCNVKKTDFDKNSIVVTARVGGGKLTMPKDKPGLDMLANALINGGGLGKHSNDDLRSILAGRNVSITFEVSEDAFTLRGITTPEDLELQLQLICAYLTDAGLRPEAERTFQSQIPSMYSKIKHTAAGPDSRIASYLHGYDSRFTYPKEEQLKSLSAKDVSTWVIPALHNDYLEISIIGDIDEATLTPILEKTIGSLPQRSKTKPDYKEARTINKQPSANVAKRFTFDSKIPTGSAMLAWKTTGLRADNIGAIRRLGVLSSILSNRMHAKIREELGEAYSPYAFSSNSDSFSDVGFIYAASSGSPEQVKPVGEIIIKLADALANEGATQDELNRVIAPKLSTLEQTTLQNSYWLNSVMMKSQEHPFRLEWARNRSSDYANITLEDINALAKQYLGKANAYRFEILPVNSAK